jgi:hypothetical protein
VTLSRSCPWCDDARLVLDALGEASQAGAVIHRHTGRSTAKIPTTNLQGYGTPVSLRLLYLHLSEMGAGTCTGGSLDRGSAGSHNRIDAYGAISFSQNPVGTASCTLARHLGMMS